MLRDKWCQSGCVMAPALFSLMIFRILIHDTINYRFDGKLFNLRRCQAKPKVQTDVIFELLCAHDMDKNASFTTKIIYISQKTTKQTFLQNQNSMSLMKHQILAISFFPL